MFLANMLQSFLTKNSCYLIKNKQEQHHLYSDRPMIDFFLVLKENFSHQPNELIEKLRNINGVVAVFEFNHQEFDIAK